MKEITDSESVHIFNNRKHKQNIKTAKVSHQHAVAKTFLIHAIHFNQLHATEFKKILGH
jgi:hypothetical protein